MLKYIAAGAAVSLLLLLYLTFFSQERIGLAVLLSIVPIAIYTLIYVQETGRLSLRKLIETVLIVLFVTAIAAIYFSQIVFIIIAGFSATGLFILLHKLIVKH